MKGVGVDRKAPLESRPLEDQEDGGGIRGSRGTILSSTPPAALFRPDRKGKMEKEDGWGRGEHPALPVHPDRWEEGKKEWWRKKTRRII